MSKELKKLLTVIIGGFIVLSIALYVSVFGFAIPEPVAHAEQKHPKEVDWTFQGVLGTVDKQSAQRGYKVYKEVCASCHGMSLVSFRNLQGLGFSEAETKAIAAEYNYPSIGEDGSAVDRKGLAFDKFPSPYPNKETAAASNGGAVPPDLSLMIKARHDGGNYVYSLLTGYDEPAPKDLAVPAGKYFNPYFPGQVIAMPKPLNDGQVEFEDGTKASVQQMSHDVVNFMQWTAEPEMEVRKRMGLKVIAFLSILTIFFYFAKIRTWARIK